MELRGTCCALQPIVQERGQTYANRTGPSYSFAGRPRHIAIKRSHLQRRTWRSRIESDSMDGLLHLTYAQILS